MQNILDLNHQPLFSSELPADKVTDNYPRQVHQACFSWVNTARPVKPTLLHASTEYLKELGLVIDDEDDFLQVMSGAKPFGDFRPYAMCYGGHQFGHWAGQLGDGRAINIAEVQVQNRPLQLQLKGSGPTPYSRTADGFAVLRSSVREYLCSEAMHHLGVPTTRALSLVTTGDKVTRDILYNGNPKDEPGAVVCRAAPTFIRFGNFEIFTSRQQIDVLKQVVHHTISQYFPHLGLPNRETYLQFFGEVTTATKEMIVHWQRVGFVHGVMNTDNMSILGLTIDYGPYGWLEDYDPNWTPNTTDAQNRRYRFGNQPSVALWNLTQLANALYPLIEDVEPLQEILDNYKVEYLADYHDMMCQKIGLYDPKKVDKAFIQSLTSLMASSELDMTIFYRELSYSDQEAFEEFWDRLIQASYNIESLSISKEKWQEWYGQFMDCVQTENHDEEQRADKMKRVNPKYVLRNYMVQLAIDEAEKGNYSLIDELYHLLLKPYEEQPSMDKWYAKRPDWAKEKVGCSMLSCSS